MGNRRGSPVLPRAEEEYLDAGLPAILGKAENIGFIDALRVDALRLGHKAHGLDAVP